MQLVITAKRFWYDDKISIIVVNIYLYVHIYDILISYFLMKQLWFLEYNSVYCITTVIHKRSQNQQCSKRVVGGCKGMKKGKERNLNQLSEN